MSAVRMDDHWGARSQVVADAGVTLGVGAVCGSCEVKGIEEVVLDVSTSCDKWHRLDEPSSLLSFHAPPVMGGRTFSNGP